MTDRPTASTINDEQLDALYAENGRLAFVISENSRRHKETINRINELLAGISRARDAAALHRQRLLSTAELYAVIEAVDMPGPAATAPAATGPRILCAHTRPGSHTTVCDLPAGHGDHRGATGYGERVTWPADGTEPAATEPATPAAVVEVRDPCPRCEGSPTRIPRHAMTDHMRTHHPEVAGPDCSQASPNNSAEQPDKEQPGA